MDSNDIWVGDLMDRQPSAKFLTSYLLANPHIKVLNVNSPWGAGKSFFLNKWKEDLGREHVCIFFNAWETDYTAEPLIALVTCIEQQTVNKLSLGSTGAGKNVIKVASVLMKKAAPLIAKGLVKKFSGVEVDELLGKEGGEQAGETAKSVVEDLIKEQSKTAVHVEDFKQAILDKLSQAGEDNSLKKPAFIFIDELDRCRPTYAIELLERVKHFFELDDCRFIVASDSTQLAHSVRAVYGEKFHSERYLSRFFDAEFRLDNSNMFAVAKQSEFVHSSAKLHISINGHSAAYGLDKSIEPNSGTVCTDEADYPECALILVSMAKYFRVELREMLRYAQQINSMASALPKHNFHYFWAAFLIFSKAVDEDLYQSLGYENKADAAIDAYDVNKAAPVNFTFADSQESLAGVAKFYVRLSHSSRQQLRHYLNNSKGWRELVVPEVHNSHKILGEYRRLVELAHRLS
ncbi:KAP family P-loop domain protein [Pseudomonas fluorescens Q2-87]|uniref:KAP family P-loop domain protein n=1 Tax=Pseudomonas fluorescens (strain Q2-87) TaxID=1038922 RepID=J2YB76_PSEFQ|nr:KAP family P-loop domain protein [Pseudomonas fluorescens]EJL04134.1 KAP family P-loop domain protein [Pseudomonas fluorescens Q2-87]